MTRSSEQRRQDRSERLRVLAREAFSGTLPPVPATVPASAAGTVQRVRRADLAAAQPARRPHRYGAEPKPAEPVVERHLEWMKRRGLSRNAMLYRRHSLRRLREWTGKPVLELTRQDLEEWQVVRSARVSRQTMHGEASNVRNFFRWACHVEQLVEVDPSAVLILPKVPKRVPRPMAEEDLGRALEGADWHMAAAIALAAFGGLRAAEIAGLTWREVTFGEDPCIRLVGKGDKERVVPMSAGLARYLLACPHRTGPVVPRRDGGLGHNQPHRVSQLVNQYLHGVGIPDTLHTLRHRFATQAYRATRDLRAVQELMGHSSPNTTAGYAAASGVAGREAVDAIDHVKHTAPPPALRSAR